MPDPRPPTILTRRGGVGDIETMLENVRVGFETYTDFAPAGWTPPNMPGDRERTGELLEHGDSWLLLAQVDGETAGHVALTPARERPSGGSPHGWRDRTPIPGVVHLWQLFVLPPWWGSGVADVLHREFIAEAKARGYESGRLYTPAAHERARRFYERRGWQPLREQLNPELGLALAEYRIDL
jgi:GNAT superfamily N-acetyltransferase